MKKKIIGSLLAVSLLASQVVPVLAVSDKSDIGTDTNTEDAMEIVYGGYNWKVIGYDGDGVASTADTVTLFASDKTDKVGRISFKIDGSSNNYNGSDLQVAVDTIYGGFADREKNAVITRHLEGGSANNAKKGMAGADVNATLWPLDVDEANALNGKLRRVDRGYWLRSPGSREDYASLVDDLGNISDRGFNVQTNIGVRPACQLKLSSIILASVAVGGKSGIVSDGMVPVEKANGLQKLTIVDNELNSGTITAKKENGTSNKVKVNVKGATASKSVSAIVTDSTGTVTHYVTIGTTDGSGNASDLDLTLPVTLDNDHILKIFVEEINNDNETDYASTPIAVTVSLTDLEKVDKAKSLADTAITNITATNTTTKDEILNAVKTAITSVNGVSVTWKAGTPVITPATSVKAGSIRGTIILTSGSETVEVVVNKVIEKLPVTPVEPPKSDLKKPTLPQTGDTSNSGFLIGFMVISGGAVVFGLKRKIKSNK